MACYSKLIPPPSPSLLPLFSPSLPHIHVCVVCVCACIFSLEVNILKTLIFRRGKVLDLKKKSRILNSNSQTLKNLIYTQNTDKNILGKTSPESVSPFLKI